MTFTKKEIARAKRESETGICEECNQPQRDCLCD
jgi:DTW domain-containing protein YfiP